MKNFILTTVFLAIAFYSVAQESTSIDLTKATLEEQYNRLYKKSNNYQVYKVVKKTELNKYWSNVSDTLKNLHQDISINSKEIREQATRIRELEESLASANGNIENLNSQMGTISFLGSEWPKGVYKTTMWVFSFSLLGLLAIVVMRFIRNNKVTRETKKLLSQTENEFDIYRKGAIQKEQEIKRELQNYMNKVMDLTGTA